MAQTLTAEMYEILEEHVDANDRIAYYEQLKAWGYKYAELALGVVRGDTLSGRTANAFFSLRPRMKALRFRRKSWHR